MIYQSKQNRKDYAPPLLGNGDIAFTADCEGAVVLHPEIASRIQAHSGYIFRAGRRQSMSPLHPAPAPLLNFGSLKFDFHDSVTDFTQALHETDGYISSSCTYQSGNQIHSRYFVHPKFNLYAVEKQFEKAVTDARFTLLLTEELLRDATPTITQNGNFVHVDLAVKAYEKYNARIVLYCDKAYALERTETEINLHFSAKNGETVCFYYLLEDDLYCDNPIGALNDWQARIKAEGFSNLLAEAKQNWNTYHRQGFVQTGNTLLDSAYRTAMYHLKCYTTRWSVPVGITDKCWHGKFFAFDEYYAYLALLESGKTDLAKRVPAFRASILDKATYRVTDYSKNPDTVQARYPWQTGEHGEELSRRGFWEDHIFHMAVIALGAFEYYEHTEDIEFLKECYPMIKACAKFYTLSAVYKNPDGSMYVGKCTDLERLGASVENPFFTSCGIIKTLEVCAKASEILDTDADYRAECLKIKEALLASLPHDGEKYVPFKGCTQKSIAVCTGKYPFDVLSNDDPKLSAALYDFMQYETTYGNMYPLGKKMSIWYAAWKSLAFARMGNSKEAFRGIEQALQSVGVFTECFEINENDALYRPWFSTAAGVLCSAVNESLLQSDGKNIYLLPALPEHIKDVSFKLSAKGGATVEAVIQNNQIQKLDITFKQTATPKQFNIYLRGNLIK